MDNHRLDPCCPSNLQQKALWEKKLQKEKAEIMGDFGDIMGKRESLLKTLGHEIRLAILQYLGTRPNCVCELVEKLAASNSAVSYHLAFLAKCGLVQTENRAGNTYYFLTDYGGKVLQWLHLMPFPTGEGEFE
ncbi:MAG: transcriptional regulator, ArsR family [Promethearchaeota archaeon CR_4]|nr:MAG: transcriptional regulator, ArsR family [Candidatus Lokiarchaeota archaeon CR_4]